MFRAANDGSEGWNGVVRMKRFSTGAITVVFLIFVISWGKAGLKFLDFNFDFATEAFLGFACLVILFVYVVYKAFYSVCPHCGKRVRTNKAFCPHCGKET